MNPSLLALLVPFGSECGKCQKPMAFMTTIPCVTEPGRVLVFQCPICEKTSDPAG
jgi:hypothetical protein